MKGKADREVKRQPRQVEEGAGPHAAKKAAYIVEIAQRLKTIVAAANGQRQPDDDIEHPGVKGFIERGSDPAEDASPDQVEDSLRHVEESRQQDQADQGRDAAARQHPIVDLEHEQRPGQIEQVDHAAHNADADEGGSGRRAELRRVRNAGHRERLPFLLISSTLGIADQPKPRVHNALLPIFASSV